MKGNLYWRKSTALFILGCFLILLVGICFFAIGKCFIAEGIEASNIGNLPLYNIVIDAGHGGRDGGAIVGEIYEKNINLSLSQKVKEFLEPYNVNVVMTRDTDTLLCEDDSLHKKREDLYNRLKLTEKIDSPLFVSIHMNKFPEEKYKGLQVFFSPNNADSEALSLLIQQNVKEFIQTDNDRQAKKANSSIYLLDRLNCPAVIIECGFLSNYEDLKNLTDEKYQRKLAFVIANSIIEFINI